MSDPHVPVPQNVEGTTAVLASGALINVDAIKEGDILTFVKPTFDGSVTYHGVQLVSSGKNSVSFGSPDGDPDVTMLRWDEIDGIVRWEKAECGCMATIFKDPVAADFPGVPMWYTTHELALASKGQGAMANHPHAPGAVISPEVAAQLIAEAAQAEAETDVVLSVVGTPEIYEAPPELESVMEEAREERVAVHENVCVYCGVPIEQLIAPPDAVNPGVFWVSIRSGRRGCGFAGQAGRRPEHTPRGASATGEQIEAMSASYRTEPPEDRLGGIKVWHRHHRYLETIATEVLDEQVMQSWWCDVDYLLGLIADASTIQVTKTVKVGSVSQETTVSSPSFEKIPQLIRDAAVGLPATQADALEGLAEAVGYVLRQR